jgi:hypothetical protein
MSKNNATASQAIARNQKLQCDLSSCNASRYGLSRYCLKHKERNIRYGSPTGSSLMLNGKQPRYYNELTYTHNLLIRNSTSKPVQAACNILLEWINAAKGGFNIAGGNLLSHISDAESVCLPILEDISAAYIHALEVKNLSDRELTYALANSLYRHVPRKYKTVINSQGKSSKRPTVKMGGKTRLAIGEHVREELGIFLANVHSHWKTQTDRATERKHDLIKPIINMEGR